MSKREAHQRPYRTALKSEVHALMTACRWPAIFTMERNPKETKIAFHKRQKAYEEKQVRQDEDRSTWVGAIWLLCENDMGLIQGRRDAYVSRYRPIQTLDGLDPHPSRIDWKAVWRRALAKLD